MAAATATKAPLCPRLGASVDCSSVLENSDLDKDVALNLVCAAAPLRPALPVSTDTLRLVTVLRMGSRQPPRYDRLRGPRRPPRERLALLIDHAGVLRAHLGGPLSLRFIVWCDNVSSEENFDSAETENMLPLRSYGCILRDPRLSSHGTNTLGILVKRVYEYFCVLG